MKKLSLLLLFSFLICNNLFSQNESRWVLHIGATIPSGDFAEDDIYKERSLGAGLGAGLNFEYIYPIGENGLGLFFGAGLNFNAMKSDYREDLAEEADLDEDDITFSKYLNLPLTTGLNYRFEADEKLSLFANFGLMVNFLKMTNMTIDFSYFGENVESVTKFDLSNALGFKLGGGIILNDKTYISLNYYESGRHKIKYNTEVTIGGDSFKEKDSFKSKISYLTLTIGFKL